MAIDLLYTTYNLIKIIPFLFSLNDQIINKRQLFDKRKKLPLQLIIIRIQNIKMSTNNENDTKISLTIFDKVSNSVNTNHSDCYQPPEKFWCKECVPSCIIEGWSSGNSKIDEFIKDTIINASFSEYYGYPLILEWVEFDRFENVEQIGEGGFAKVYSAKWIDGKSKYRRVDGIWKKLDSEPITVALKRLSGSQNISVEYLNEVFKLYNFHLII